MTLDLRRGYIEEDAMKKPKNKGNKQGPQPPEIIRHYETLTPKETDEVVESVVELIVNFVKKGDSRSQSQQTENSGQPQKDNADQEA